MSLHHILETFPRDDLFQIPDEDLFETAIGILSLGERQRLRLFVWRDPFERFVSCLVYVPRESFSTELRIKVQRILLGAFNGSVIDFDVLLGETASARIHFTVRTTPGGIPPFERSDVERQLAAAARRWDDELRERLVEARGEGEGLALFKRWAAAFPPEYRDRVPAAQAVPDVRKLATLSQKAPLALSLYPVGSDPGSLGLKVYRRGAPLVLSDSLPMLEHMGARVLSEASYRIGAQRGDEAIAVHDFRLHAPLNAEFDIATLAPLFEETFARVLHGDIESDDFNRLVLLAALSADDVLVLRAYAKYLKQIGFAQSQSTIAATLAAHPRIARMLVTEGLADDFEMAVAERLCQPEERIVSGISIQAATQMPFADPNVVLLWRHTVRAPQVLFGLPDASFEQRHPEKGLITKNEVRAVSLARLQLRLDSVVWDIGAGSGSVGLEAARLCRMGHVYAIEKNVDDSAIVQRNRHAMGISNHTLVHGKAPEGLQHWPDPDAVFVGGSGGELAELIRLILQRLKAEGWLVMNFVTIENLGLAVETLKSLGVAWDVLQLQAARSKPILHMNRMAAENPVWLVCAQKVAVRKTTKLEKSDA
jgi:precorrin-6Y C5,15-methyltransferase (decarboxylating) CbiT subunit